MSELVAEIARDLKNVARKHGAEVKTVLVDNLSGLALTLSAKDDGALELGYCEGHGPLNVSIRNVNPNELRTERIRLPGERPTEGLWGTEIVKDNIGQIISELDRFQSHKRS